MQISSFPICISPNVSSHKSTIVFSLLNASAIPSATPRLIPVGLKLIMYRLVHLFFSIRFYIAIYYHISAFFPRSPAFPQLLRQQKRKKYYRSFLFGIMATQRRCHCVYCLMSQGELIYAKILTPIISLSALPFINKIRILSTKCLIPRIFVQVIKKTLYYGFP